MPRKKQIFLLMSDGGGGHRNVAEAIAQNLQPYQKDIEIHIINAFVDICHEPEELYNFFLKRDLGGPFSMISFRIFFIYMFFFKQRYHQYFINFWSDKKPDLVVSLIPFLNPFIKKSLEDTHPNVPMCIQMTDLHQCIKHYWFSKSDQLLCPNTHSYQQALDAGFMLNEIKLIDGIVMRKNFYLPILEDKSILRYEIGLDPQLKTLIISYGMQGITKKVFRLLKAIKRTDIQFIVLCGKNIKLRDKLTHHIFPFKVAALGYRNDLEKWLYASDLFIGKPGPGTITEALSMGLVLLLDSNWRTLRQERSNAKQIRDKQQGLLFSNIEEFIHNINYLLEHNNYTRFQQQVLKEKKNLALQQVCDYYLSTLHIRAKNYA